MALRGHRLGVILRKFGLSSAELAGQEPKLIISSLKTEFNKKAKASHPDLAGHADQAEAQSKFIKLRQEYEEALKLLEGGFRPTESQQATNPFHQPGAGSASDAPPGQSWKYEESKSKQPEFDFATRLKGSIVVATVFTFLCYFFPEFLALSAGSTMKWHAGNGVRRWGEVPAEAAVPKSIPVKVQVERKVDPFYEKRGAKKKVEKYSPRGLGGTSKITRSGTKQIS